MTSTSQPWHHYLNRRMLICVFLGFTSGLPLFILLSLLQAWLAKSGLNVKALGLFALVMFPYTWKFLWSPLMDRFHFGRMGRRRGWMALTQVALFIAIGVMGMFDPINQLSEIAAMASLVAFLSASQDIVIDAYRREILPDSEQGLGSAIHVNAYKVAGMVPGALSLVLADILPWHQVFWITAGFMLPGLICTLLIKEPKVYGDPPKNIRAAVLLPFQEFVSRNGWQSALWVLGFIFLYKLGDSMATALATKFYIDLGFTMTQIGAISKTTSLWSSVAGGIIGGIWMVKIGINRALWIFGVVQAVTILGFAWLANVGAEPFVLAIVIGAEAFGVGLGTAAFVAYIARTTDPRYTATQFALFTSLAAVPRTFINSSVGYIIAETGWFNFFILCFVLALPGMLLLPKVAPWNEKRINA
ncbi:AmpG family muropeptide MFS transporter [Glaciimonas sp. Gout2]|uniref:AmpG family muropeptide MFS transporter n=2 Tax=Glaciimonas TaxID=1229970 RepID=UPI002AB590E6|nr:MULTISPECIES: AmpG family muropeptide MFS transporter [unclassified Glaciimonas]MDY7546271.1 AmpG family muropeptide MFS transporter [Glaciimonas sp. CA11.2]MEB0010780.1 AmpG family muropeptide MFS transporter [Glaciimonas sp. Cout2]MEB0082084.1 AmpG family muropeptide MFS transporter [Glaciimonas sp. Gout2]